MDEEIVNIFDTWAEEGGLITIQLAAHLIGVSQQAISNAADAKKLKSFQFRKKRYLSYNDVLRYIAKRSIKSTK